MTSKIQPQDFKGNESLLSLNPAYILPRDAGLSGYPTLKHQNSSEEQQAMVRAVLQDPVLMERLCDRVWDLLEADLRQQWERSQGSRRRI